MLHSTEHRHTLTFLFLGLLAVIPANAQTDETIFRDFRFDFSTPGARANAMGRAFVGLADESTAAYNNPAGLAVLNSPEFSIEFRINENDFDVLTDKEGFDVVQDLTPTTFRLERVGFLSYAFSYRDYNFSLFYVNNLDYRRDPVEDRIDIVTPTFFATYLNSHHVRKIQLDTTGFSVSRNFGKLALGLAVAAARFQVDFEYFTSLNSPRLFLNDLVASEAEEESYKPSYVFGAMYQANPKIKLGFAYKRQPRYTFTERVRNSEFPNPDNPQFVPITFKIPDSIQVGLAYQPNDFWTFLLDADWIRYEQLIGDNMTILTRLAAPQYADPGEFFFSFDKDDYTISDTPEVHLGGEYLIPLRDNILALRFGSFFDPDHKTRFVGETDNPAAEALYDLQRFTFNVEEEEDNVGLTLGLGFVWKDKLQMDVALVQSDRFQRVVTSLLYRF